MTDIAAPPAGLAARKAAFAVLTSVLDRSTPLEDALEAEKSLAKMAPRDRGFVRHLVATTLRRLGQIDALLASALDRGLDEKAHKARAILRLGVAQIAFMGTPAHAAVGSSVDLADAVGAERQRGLINAVLRRLTREAPAMVAAQDEGRLNLPDWLWRSWSKAYGVERTKAIGRALLTEAPLDLSVKADAAAWAEKLGATLLPTGSLRLGGEGLVTALPGFEEGAWWVQDAGAALPAQLLGDVKDKRIADLCAAPGGKTLQLAAAGAQVTAVDRAAKRLERVRDNLKRVGLKATLLTADAGSWRPNEPFDGVLLDAPCSATGTARRHPDVLRLKRPADVDGLAEVQARLLAASVHLVKPGGTIVYSTCSLEPEEGAARIEAILKKDDRVERLPITAGEFPGIDPTWITPEGDLRTTPADWAEVSPAGGGLDGFFAARLRRIR